MKHKKCLAMRSRRALIKKFGENYTPIKVASASEIDYLRTQGIGRWILEDIRIWLDGYGMRFAKPSKSDLWAVNVLMGRTKNANANH